MTKSVKEMKEVISSFNSKSTALNKLIPIKFCGSTVLGLMDSGNSFYNAISLAVANKIGLTNFDHYTGPPVGTALVGSTSDIVSIVSKIGFGLTNESGQHHSISSRLVIVRHLSYGLNISLPFLVKNGLDQLHSQGLLLWSHKCLQVSALPEYGPCSQSDARVFSDRGVAGLKLLGGPGLHRPLPPSYGIYIYILEFAKLLGGPGPPGPVNAATPLSD